MTRQCKTSKRWVLMVKWGLIVLANETSLIIKVLVPLGRLRNISPPILKGWCSRYEKQCFSKLKRLGHYNIPGTCRADELARAGAFRPECLSIELGVPFASVKLAIARKFFRDANLFWVNVEFCSTVRFTSLFKIEDLAHNYWDMVVTSFRTQLPCLQVIALWADTWKKWALF